MTNYHKTFEKATVPGIAAQILIAATLGYYLVDRVKRLLTTTWRELLIETWWEIQKS
ncbi:hypothetical protein [Mesorhizobium sangaii]|uniref:Precorrin-2 methylase n=1 Tax=Mesorhizobium sangaii TaxID=505389 RepID=A0A841PM98_9HYPH|nr:hypothetical protein [Mesorhizobium sangaii]MBB6413798.1 precorrin-2 methylase [Mesorhizobium sangaii]